MKLSRKIEPICVSDFANDYIGDSSFKISEVSSLKNANKNCLTFYKGEDIGEIQNISCGALIVQEHLKKILTEKKYKCSAIIFSDSPMGMFTNFVNERFNNNFTDNPYSFDSEKISKFSYIEDGAKIGSNCLIYPHTSIYKNTVIGNRCVIQTNTVIGGIGMSYVKDSTGKYTRLTHLGNLIIEDDVEIGCNTTVLLGILESTIIKTGAKIGNHVNVGHNCVIGKNTYISAGVMIGGATEIGENCWIAPGASIRDNIKIGDNCTIGLGSVVVKDTEPNSIYMGNPAKLYKRK